MEDLYTMISKYLTKAPVYTRTISTIRAKSPFIDLQIEGEKNVGLSFVHKNN